MPNANLHKVTDFERIATVSIASTFKCPKCGGNCVEGQSKANSVYYDCDKCNRGWRVLPFHIETLEQAMDWVESEDAK